MIKLCIFDMDGLLIDSERVYLESALACSEKYSYGLSKELILSTMGLNLEATCKRFIDVMGPSFPMEEFLENEQVFHEEYLERYGLEQKKGVKELFAYLDEKNIRKVIATSTYRETADRYLKMASLEGCFDHIVYGDDLTESKPLPQIYLKAMAAFDFKPEEMLAFEDSPNGILSAYNAGLRVIHIPDLAYVAPEIKEKSFVILEDLSQTIKLLEDLNK